jgi:hypothetical protein
MKSTAILSVASVVAMQQTAQQPGVQEPVNLQEHGQLIDTLFSRLSVLFPAAAPATTQLGTYKSEWLKTLAIHKVLNKQSVQAGLMRARQDTSRKYWPTPLQFATWCKGSLEDHNLPSCDDAFREAVRNYRTRKTHSWSHTLVYAAVQQVGTWAFSQSSERELRAQFEHVYTQLSRRFIEGQPIDIDLPKALPVPGTSTRIASPNCEGRLRALKLLGKTA